MSESTTALVKQKSVVSDLSLTPQKFVEAALSSGLFKDTKDVAQAYIKISLGASLGLDPVTAMASIYLVQGKPSLSTNLMVARVLQRCERYRYEIIQTDDRVCKIQFYHRIEDFTDDGKPIKRWVKPGPPEEFNMDTAKAAGLTKNPVWTSWPKNMLFNRCFSNACKKYAADLLNGVPIYAPDELDPNMKMVVTSEGEVIPDAEYTPAVPKPTVKTDDSYIAAIRSLMAETNTDEKAFLTELLKKDSVDKLTGAEQTKVFNLLTTKKKAQPPF